MGHDLKQKLRILHLPVIVLNQATLYSKALRSLGHKCDYLLYDISQEDASLHDQCDINLGLTDKSYWQRFRSIARFIHESLDRYDIYHFHSGRTFIPLMAFSRWSFLPNWLGRYLEFLDFLDLPYLKRNGKKLVFQFWGCDARSPEFELRRPESPCLFCPTELQKMQCDRKLKAKTERLTLKYGDARIGTGDLIASHKDFLWVRNAIDTSDWKPIPFEEIPIQFRFPQKDTIKIYHSFSKSESRGDIKGSRPIFKAIDILKDEGHNIELMFFDYVPHKDIRYYQMQADIVVDQLRCGIYGNTGVECLSMGKPVVCYFTDHVDELMQGDCPVVRANTENITSVLRRLVIDEEYRKTLGEQSRLYAMKYHDLKVVGKRLEDIYYSLF